MINGWYGIFDTHLKRLVTKLDSSIVYRLLNATINH